MPKKKVLFIVSQPFFAWRGSPIRVGYDVQALGELGYQVDLLVPPFGEDRTIANVSVHRVARIPGIQRLLIGPSFPKLLFDVLLFFRARKLMRQNNYAILHGVEDAGALCALLTRKKGIPFIFEKHSDPSSYKKGFLHNAILFLYAKVECWIVRRAHGVVCTGPELADAVRAIDSGKRVWSISDIPSSLAESNAKEAAVAREKYLQCDDEVIVTYVGSFAVYQGIDLLFASIPLVCQAASNVRFLIIGGSAEEIAVRRLEVQRAGVSDKVTFAGKIPPDDLPAVLSGSDILLSPRISGSNTPLKLLDYLKAGRAIVATDIPANRQILNADTACFADCSAESFSAAVLSLAQDQATRESLAVRGRAMIETMYNFGIFSESLGGLYASILRSQ